MKAHGQLDDDRRSPGFRPRFPVSAIVSYEGRRRDDGKLAILSRNPLEQSASRQQDECWHRPSTITAVTWLKKPAKYRLRTA